MKKILKSSLVVLLLAIPIIYLTSCEKDPVPPKLTTSSISAITQTTASSGGNITADGGAMVTARGVCWGTSMEPDINDNKTSDGSGSGIFSSELTELVPGTTYYVRSYASNKAGTSYGAQLSFTSGEVVLPAVTTSEAGSITLTTAVSGGEVTDNGGGEITARGICWNTASNPTTDNNITSDGTGTGSFTSDLSGLDPETDYFVRAYATNSAGTAYGNEITFTTNSIQVATLTTDEASAITMTSATSGGNITDNGGAEVTARGICWATTSGPTTGDNITNDGTGTGSFTSDISGLEPGTEYYVRAYATNSAGTAYGNEIIFTTSPVELPALTTDAASAITQTSATSGGNITDNGGAEVTARGICWATTSGPTTAGNTTSDGAGTGSFTSDISGLVPGTEYYVRAYATNSAGTAYGNEITFTTNPVELAALTTDEANTITLTSATSGGNITDNGGGDITARGICWATTTVPTTADNITSNGTGTGGFTSDLSGLEPGTEYFVRAYATNSAGTAYGNEISFTTLQLATLTTEAAGSTTTTSAVSGGNITDAGSGLITERGVCWSLSASPTTDDSKTADGTGTGVFSSTIEGLNTGTTYYVRAYAVNDAGTAYGDEVTFTTLPFTDVDGNEYKTVIIGTQLWMAENLKTTSYNDGSSIPLVTDGTEWANLTTPAYCFYENDEATYGDIYGALYNYYTASNADLCPDGWHVPDASEWATLTTYLGGDSLAGGELKETGLSHWLSPNTGATNESGFTALPGGLRSWNGDFGYITEYGNWGSSTQENLLWVSRRIGFNRASIPRLDRYKENGYSIRCIKD